ncbi:L,D-transpeptidase family protein [Marmoricola sp. OAE513]|uniref:L,D-transpeptidase family protein n=1 Tax=Marmoricola sp. OAE513 TaxID=2817894 RepID=UPI001E0C7D9D
MAEKSKPQKSRRNGMTMFVVLLVAVGALGYGVAEATAQLQANEPAALPAPSSAPSSNAPTAQPSSQSGPKAPPQQVLPEAEPLEPVPALLEPGDNGPRVRSLQSRLRQIAWYAGKVTDDYDAKTTEAVRGFQAKRGLPELGYVDEATLTRLKEMTRLPTKDELANKISDGTWTDSPLDPRCRTGRAMCVDKTSRTIRWVVDGEVQRTMAVRFGSSYTPTREGLFHVNSKSRNHVSSLYDTPMPFAMFFSRGQAVHYSPDFAARGYNGASHGCVNVKDYEGIKALFDEVQVGDKVVVYWA